MKKTEICLHCEDNYIPTRRGIQKFCSKSCKSRFWYLKQNLKKNAVTALPQGNFEEQKPNADKMTWAGVGNAAAGVAVVEAAKLAFTLPENKPATKKDIQELKALITGRYLPVNNAGKDAYGRSPFYDTETGNLVYFKI